MEKDIKTKKDLCHSQVYRLFFAKFHGNRFNSFCVTKPETERQTNRQTNKETKQTERLTNKQASPHFHNSLDKFFRHRL